MKTTRNLENFNMKSNTEKIGEAKTKICFNPEHNPPQFQAFKPGNYKHTCPACGKVTFFEVPLILC